MAQPMNRDDLLIAEFKEAFNEFDKVRHEMCFFCENDRPILYFAPVNKSD